MALSITDSPDIATAVSLALEKSINLALRYDPATREQLRSLSPTKIAVIVSEPEIPLLFLLENDGVLVRLSSDTSDADIRLSGKATEFLSLMGKETHSLGDVNIDVSGKVSVLNQLQSILKGLDIDWEEPLTEILGVVPGHQAASIIRRGFAWGKTQHATFVQALPEILSEELQLLPSQTELTHFYNAVDDVSAATQRVQARIQQLHNNQNK